jgi:GcrA cell cycle regulator
LFRISEIRAGAQFGRLTDAAARHGKAIMQSSNWAAEHCQALREYRARGLSYGRIAKALNAKFGTTYTRNAALGRGVRMGLPSPEWLGKRAKQLLRMAVPNWPKSAAGTNQLRHVAAKTAESGPALERDRPVQLRCVGITPRLISLIELEAGDCRYPYGGDKDGEPINFCGHPKLPGSSYCAPHFRLTRDDGAPSERAAGPVVLRLVEADLI